MPCLSGTCAETTVRRAPSELADFAAALPSGHPLHVGIYFAAYSSCAAPSAAYDRALLASVLALPSVHGATVYVTEPLPPGGAAACVSGAPGADLDKGCVVRNVFGAWNATAEATTFDAACPAVFPFRTSLTTAGHGALFISFVCFYSCLLIYSFVCSSRIPRNLPNFAHGED